MTPHVFARPDSDEVQMIDTCPVSAAAKPLDDPHLQQLFGDAIEGALAFGYQGTNLPPQGHWLQRFWDIGNAERRAAQRGESTSEADADEVDEWFAVLSPSRSQGVIFKSERDAKWTSTGVLRSGFGVPTIGESFRDAYAADARNFLVVKLKAIKL